MSVESRARRDAREFALAKEFYGEGAGVRRRHIGDTVAARSSDPVYAVAFRAELARQDKAELVKKAKRERRRRDIAESASRNTKALVSGNVQQAQAGFVVVAAVAYFMHQTGLDRKVVDKTRNAVHRFRTRRAPREAKVYNITDVR